MVGWACCWGFVNLYLYLFLHSFSSVLWIRSPNIWGSLSSCKIYIRKNFCFKVALKHILCIAFSSLINHFQSSSSTHDKKPDNKNIGWGKFALHVRQCFLAPKLLVGSLRNKWVFIKILFIISSRNNLRMTSGLPKSTPLFYFT